MPRVVKLLHIAGVGFIVLVLILFSVSVSKKNIYLSSQGINILLITSEGMGVVSVRHNRGMAELTRLPDNLVIEIGPTGTGYLVEAIYKVGLPFKDQLELARVNIGRNLGVALVGVVKANTPLSVAGLREALFSFSTGTNLGLIDRYKLIKDLTDILGNGSTLTASLPSNVFESVEEPDGKKVFQLNPAIFVWSRNRWVSDEILSETAELMVVNGSGQEGRARLVARQIETAGGRVIDVISSKKEVDNACLLFGDTKAHPQTAAFVTASFSCETSEKTLDEFVESDVRSDLIMVIGKGF